MFNKKVDVLIADDDEATRRLLKSILTDIPWVEVVGEAGNGKELLEKVDVLEPQVIMADIGMPEMDGLTAVRQLMEEDPELIVIFITGYTNYAVDAFEISTFDYLVKPILPERVLRTFHKVKTRLEERENDIIKLARLIKGPDKLCIKVEHELHFIDTNSIYFLAKEKKKTVIYTRQGKFETYESLNDLEKKLDSNSFLRSHKSYLINLKMIERVVPWGDAYLVRFSGINSDALISRYKVKLLHELLPS